MTDEEYVFHQTSRERKRNGIGDFSKKRQGGKTVRLPSDNLSRKEWEKMNGEVETFKLNRPMKWQEYKALPDDLKIEYLNYLTEEYNVGGDTLGRMFGVSGQTVSNEKKRLGIKKAPSQHSMKTKKRWQDFLGEKTIKKDNYDKVFTVKHMPTAFEVMQIETAKQSLADMLRAYLGTGAKITIELTL